MNVKKLGFGLMRLPLTDENDAGSIDIKKTCEMVDEFINRGFTYFDTAIMYCNFKSEEAVKEILVKRHPRDAFKLATKLHSRFIKNADSRDEIFNSQLEKTGAGFFDYYLLHGIGKQSYEIYTKYDCFNWLIEKKKAGLVKNIGFSFHDDAEFLDKILTEHPEMEFVQLQINYLDWESEGVQSKKCYEVATKHKKPVIVMEPVKGGTLAKVPENIEKLFKAYNESASVPSWAIRFTASLENVFMVLSGMSNMEQLIDNTNHLMDLKPLTENEKKVIKTATDMLNSAIEISCTGCEYCLDGCPKNIAIPKYFSLYNADKQEIAEKQWTPQGEYYDNLAERFGKASDCIACGQCEAQCPQHLPIIESLKKVAKHFE